MRKLLYAAFIAAMTLALGCAITNYPVIFDTRGADDEQILESFYDKAYIIPSGQVATIYDDGSDELFTEVAQDWKGDQWLYTFNNFDPTATVLFLDQTYCDPTRQTDCAAVVAWNPDLPEAYSYGSSPINETDDPFDSTVNDDCSGARSFSVSVSYGSRIGECGSGIWTDKQAAAREFADLPLESFRGTLYPTINVDNRNTLIELTAIKDGATDRMPVYGSYKGFIDEHMRLILPVTPNARFNLRWLSAWTGAHGADNEVNVVYNGLDTNFTVSVMPLDDIMERAH
jgi:hypothetical protein